MALADIIGSIKDALSGSRPADEQPVAPTVKLGMNAGPKPPMPENYLARADGSDYWQQQTGTAKAQATTVAGSPQP